MRAPVRYKQLLGEVVELKDHFRIYGKDGIFYITDTKEEAIKVATKLLTEEQE